MSIGINVTLRQARTGSDREIRGVYNIRQSFVLRYIQMAKATRNKLVGTLAFPTKPVPLSEYLRTKKSSRGVTVQIFKGKNELIKGAFLLNSRYSSTGRMSVMHRSHASGSNSYGSNFQFRHKRITKSGNDLTIGAMFSVSPFTSVFNRVVSKNITTKTAEKLQFNVHDTMDKMVRGVIKDANNRGRRNRR